jgi:hypothetical protein
VTGIVCVVRPDSAEVEFAVRLPSQQGVTLHAEASARGAMVTMAAHSRESALLHLSDTGELLGHRAAHGAPPAVLLETGVVLYDQEREWLFLLDEVLKPITKKRVPFDPLESAAAANRKSFALADDGSFLVGTVNDKLKLELSDPFKYASYIKKSKRKSKAAKARAVWDPKRPGGPASVGFSAARPVAPWQAESGKEFTMELCARSGGGKGRGIVVSVAGDALANAEFDAVVFNGEKIPFEKQADGSYRAEVPDVELIEAIRYPFDPKPKNDPQKETAKRLLDETHFELQLLGRATKASGDLLTVYIGPLETEKPPLKWMRPLLIS